MRFITIFPIIITFIFQGSVFAASNSALDFSSAKTEELVFSRHILTYQGGQALGKLIANIRQQNPSLELLRGLALAVTKKVTSDQASMQFLLFELEKLAKDDYSAKIGSIKPANLKPCWNKMNKLLSDMKNARPKFGKKDKPLDSADYLKILNNNSGFLTGNSKTETIRGVWDSIEKQTGKAYALWNEHFRLLMKKTVDAKAKEPKEILNNEELRFVKIFSRAKIIYDRLAGRLVK
jgi:hypothetical protein